MELKRYILGISIYLIFMDEKNPNHFSYLQIIWKNQNFTYIRRRYYHRSLPISTLCGGCLVAPRSSSHSFVDCHLYKRELLYERRQQLQLREQMLFLCSLKP